MQSLNDKAYLACIANKVAAELDALNQKTVSSDDLLRRPATATTLGPSTTQKTSKPRTVSEHRKERETQADSVGVGSLFVRPNPDDLLELQYVFLFALAESSMLRSLVASASPKKIQTLYLPYIQEYFYRHLSGISEKKRETDKCPQSNQGSSSVHMWVANELLRISMLYNCP